MRDDEVDTAVELGRGVVVVFCVLEIVVTLPIEEVRGFQGQSRALTWFGASSIVGRGNGATLVDAQLQDPKGESGGVAPSLHTLGWPGPVRQQL